MIYYVIYGAANTLDVIGSQQGHICKHAKAYFLSMGSDRLGNA